MVNPAAKAVAIVILIALAIIAQVIVGVLGNVSQTAGNVVCAGNLANTANTGCANYNTAGNSTTTTLNFMVIVFLVGALVIVLDLFGVAGILRFGHGGRSE